MQTEYNSWASFFYFFTLQLYGNAFFFSSCHSLCCVTLDFSFSNICFPKQTYCEENQNRTWNWIQRENWQFASRYSETESWFRETIQWTDTAIERQDCRNWKSSWRTWINETKVLWIMSSTSNCWIIVWTLKIHFKKLQIRAKQTEIFRTGQSLQNLSSRKSKKSWSEKIVSLLQ